jgi:hypothetical protein
LYPDKNHGLGTYTLTVTATDEKGVSTTGTYSYDLVDDDDTGPTITLGGSVGLELVSETQEFTWDVTDPSLVQSTTVEVTHDGTKIYPLASDSPPPDFGSFNFDSYGPGMFEITVSATDADNDRRDPTTGLSVDAASSGPVSRTVLVLNTPPTARAGLNQVVDEGSNVVFDGTDSSDADGDALTFTWDFGDPADPTPGSGSTPSHLYSNNGTYGVTLTVDDGYGVTSQDSVTVRVENVAPQITSLTNTGPVLAGQPVTVTVIADDVAADLPLTYEFDVGGDGAYDVSNNSGELTRTFLQENVYPIDVRVSDNDGGEVTGWTAVQVGMGPGTSPFVSFTTASTPVVAEDVGVVTIEAQLTQPVPDHDVVVPLTLTGTARNSQDCGLHRYLRIPAGQALGSLDVSVIDDSYYEGDVPETLHIAMDSPINASLHPDLATAHTITIQDNDPRPEVAFSAGTQTADEHDGTVAVTARLTAAAGLDVTVPLAISGTATVVDDYTLGNEPPSILIPAGDTTGYCTITIQNDSVPESGETITLKMLPPDNADLSEEAGSTIQHTITIPGNDAPGVSFDSAHRRVEEGVGSVTVTATLSTLFHLDVDVPWTISGTASSTEGGPTDPQDYSLSSADPLRFAAGQTEATIDIDLLSDEVPEPKEFLVLTMGQPTNGARLGATSRHILEISDDDSVAVSFATAKQTAFEDAGSVTVTASLSKPSTLSVVVPVEVSGGTAAASEYQLESGTITIPSGQTQGNVRLQIFDDAATESSETVTLELRDPENAELGVPFQHTVTVKDDDPVANLQVGSQSVSESGDSVTIAATLSAATNKTVIVPFSAHGTARPGLGGDYEISPGSYLSIPPGTTTAEITVTPLDDTYEEGTETLTITMGDPVNAHAGSHQQHTIYIEENDAIPSVSFTTSCTRVWETIGYSETRTVGTGDGGLVTGVEREGNQVRATFEIVAQMSHAIDLDVWVPIRIGSDDPYPVRIPAGETSVSLGFSFLGNGIENEDTEEVISMRTPLNARLGAQTSHTVYIANYYPDSAMTVNLSMPTIHSRGEAAGPACSNPVDYTVIEPDEDGIYRIAGIPLEFLWEAGSFFFGLYNASDGYISGGTAFFDNGNGILDFLDLNQDGIQDPDEPSELATMTRADGVFLLPISEAFDLNGNGTLDADEGRIVVTGGIDRSTGRPQSSPLIAPAGVHAVTPLSTLMAKLVEQGATLGDAHQQVVDAFDLGDVDLRYFDPTSKTANGDPDGPRVLAAAAKLQDTVTQTASLIAGVTDAPPASVVADIVMADMAAKIAEPGSALDLSMPLVVQSVIEGALASTGVSLDTSLDSHAAVLQGAATVIAAGNQFIDDELAVADGPDLLARIAQKQSVAQGNAAAQLAEAANGVTSIDVVVTNNTGEELESQIVAASIGSVIPVSLSISDANIVENDTGQMLLEFVVSLDGPATDSVSVEYSTSDFSAMVDDDDYQAVVGTLTWDAGETSQTIQVPVIGDAVFEPDEKFSVQLTNASGAFIKDGLGLGTIVNDDPMHYEAPVDGQPNRLELRTHGTYYELLRNDETVLNGMANRAVPIFISGAAGVENSLSVDVLGSADILVGGLHFQGGGLLSDTLTVLDDTATEVVHMVTGPRSGTFWVDGATISYADVESASDHLVPTITGMPAASTEGMEVSLIACGADPDVTYDFQWIVIKDGDTANPFASGSGTTIQFTPDDEGQYEARLTTDAEGRATATTVQTVTVDNVAPSFNAGGNATLLPDVLGVFSRPGIEITDPGADTWSGTVDYGDDTGDQPLNIDQEKMTFDLNHTYTSSGTYTVTVKVEDDDRGVATGTFHVEVILAEVEFAQAAFVDLEDVGTSLVVELVRTPAGTNVTSQVEVAITGGTATGGIDYDDAGFRLLLTFDPGVDVVSVPVAINGDNIVELDETIAFSVTSVSNALILDQDTATLTIQNDDTAEFTVDSVSGNEDNGPLTFTVTLSNPVDVATSVVVSTSDGTALLGDSDYTGKSLTLPFAAEVTSQTFTVALIADRKVELDETFSLGLGNVENAGRSVTASSESGTGTILNDDSATITIDDVSQAETDSGQTAFVFTVTLSEQVDTTVGLLANTADDTGRLDDSDYQQVADLPVTFIPATSPGPQTQTVTVQVNGDVKVEPHETFFVDLSGLDAEGRNVIFADDQGLGAILNDDFLAGWVFDDVDNDGLFETVDGDEGIAGVLIQLVDESSNTVVDDAVTGNDGRYQFDATLAAGTYKIVQVFEDDPNTPDVDEGSQLGALGLLDGKETPGVNGGMVHNSQDCNEITGIDVGGSGSAQEAAVDYLFAEIEPSDIFGMVWRDFNNNGEVDIAFDEAGIDGVTVTLSGTDDRGNAISKTQVSDGGGSYAFIDLRPGTYAIEETQPAGYDDGLEGDDFQVTNPHAVNQPPAIDRGTNSSNDVFSEIRLAPKTTGDYYNFGERPQAGGPIGDNVTATTGFWHNKNGQALIKSLNGDPDSTQLGDWLAATFPNMYGDNAAYHAASGGDQDMNLAGKTNAEIAEIFQYLHKRNKKTSVAGGPPKVDAQVMAVALATYVTSETLAGGAYAADYGFDTSPDGIAYTTFNVLDVLTSQQADDLGLTPVMDAAGRVTIIDILLATDERASDGLLYDTDESGSIGSFELTLRTLANELYTAINEGSDI